MIRRFILRCENVKYWWQTWYERAAYSRLFKDRAVRTHPTSVHGRKQAADHNADSACGPLSLQSHEDKHRAASERADQYDRKIFHRVTSVGKLISERMEPRSLGSTLAIRTETNVVGSTATPGTHSA
jgi:hypothetical protein